MAASQGDTSTYLDPVHRLALGWVTPFWINESGWYELTSVATGGDVAILPRKNGGDGREYFLLERRRDQFLWAGNYDAGHGSLDGIVIWHVVESPARSQFGPSCMDPQEWLDKTDNNGRRGIRVLRPDIEYAAARESEWNMQEGYDITSFALTCPNQGVPHNALIWSDGTPSGYAITDFPESMPGVDAPMTFYVEVD
jgi:hypothetical protein